MHNTELSTSNIGDVGDLTDWGQFAATNRVFRQRFFHLSDADKDFCMELVLWALSISDKLGKTASGAMNKLDSR